MPRNDQITRQWHLLRRLDGSSGLTLNELVESVPEDYPKNTRTVRYRVSVHSYLHDPGRLYGRG